MSMQSFRSGFFSVRQKRARWGRSGWGLPPRRTGRLGAAGAAGAAFGPAADPGVPFVAPSACVSVLNCWPYITAPPAALDVGAAVAVVIVADNVFCHTSVDDERLRRKKIDRLLLWCRVSFGAGDGDGSSCCGSATFVSSNATVGCWLSLFSTVASAAGSWS